MLSYAAMKRLLILAFVLFAFPAAAGEKTPLGEFLDSMPAMDPRDRAAFDKAARAMYRDGCKCLRYLATSSGKVAEARLPLSDSDRRLLIMAIRETVIIPLESKGRAY